MYKYIKSNNDIVLEKTLLNLDKTLDCGQAFRWEKDKNGFWHGVVKNRHLILTETSNHITFKNTSESDFLDIWVDYFDLNRDYKKINDEFSKNNILKSATEFSKGIRILNQDPWEALCSFIISQNNNIPRIKGIILRLCENFGKELDGLYTFPSAETIASCTLEDLSVLKSGFRAKYILDAAKKVNNGEIDFEYLKKADINTARNELIKIYGVGNKVADCTLLFGLKHFEAFPKDVWIKKAMNDLFNGELPSEYNQYAGIAQQYIFYYARTLKI